MSAIEERCPIDWSESQWDYRNQWKIKHTFDSCLEKARGCKTRTEFRKAHRHEYDAALRNDWLDEIADECGMPVDSRFVYSLERCALEAMKYKTRGEFKRGSLAHYKACIRNRGWLDLVMPNS